MSCTDLHPASYYYVDCPECDRGTVDTRTGRRVSSHVASCSMSEPIRIGSRVRMSAADDDREGTVDSYVPGFDRDDAVAHVVFDCGEDHNGRPLVSAAWFGSDELEVIS